MSVSKVVNALGRRQTPEKMYLDENGKISSATSSIMDSPTLARVERAMQRQEGKNIFRCQVHIKNYTVSYIFPLLTFRKARVKTRRKTIREGVVE